MYAIKIRKSDLALLKLLNFGVEPKIGTKTSYLVIHLEDHVPNEVLAEKEFFEKYEPAVNAPSLLKLKKSRY